ncbi:MAG: hypothetical protein ACK5O2_00965 [Microthrixaceae bacterium]
MFAYLDPASGSLIAATAAAGLAGVGVAAKSMWQRQTSRFRKAGAGADGESITDADADEITEPTDSDR